MPGSIAYTWSDAWLLLSVIHAARDDGGADLKDIIGMGDAFNKAVFTPQELRRGMAKLTRAGYIAESGGRFFVTDKSMSAYQAISGGRPLEQLSGLERALGAAPYPTGDPSFEDPQWPYPSLSDEVISAAEQQYRNDFAEAYRQLRERDAGA